MAANDPPGSSRPVNSTPVTPVLSSPAGYTYEHATQSVVWAMAVNIAIAGLKFGAWTVSQSPSMFSEGLHSLGDAFNSLTLLVGLKQSNKAADRTHPFGYGLEASVWALLACAFLLVFAVVAIVEGVHKLQEPVEALSLPAAWAWITPYQLSAGVLIASIAMELFAMQKGSLAVLEERGIRHTGGFAFFQAFSHVKQVVAPTTRYVFYEETLALIGAVFALGAITVTEYGAKWGWIDKQYAHIPDAGASIIIGLALLGMAVYLFSHNRSILTGMAAGPQVEKKVTALVEGIDEVSEVHDLVTIDRGPAGLSIHMTVEVEPNTPVKDVDDLVERIKEKLQSRIQNVSQVFIEVLADESDQEWSEKFIQLVEQGQKDEIIKPREEAILKNFYNFTQVAVEDVMVPRIDVIAIDITASIAEAADMLIEGAHSRLPVYEEDRDTIKGLIHMRDVFEKLHQGKSDETIESIVREMDFYPENKPVSDLLEDFKRSKIQMAAVMDEYGGFAGIVTIEDLMEEIVGDIWDEHDEEDTSLDFLDEMTVTMNGMTNIDEVNEQLDLNIPNEEFTTVGGFVFGELGREPEVDDTVDFEDLVFTVKEVEGTRILTLTLTSPVPFKKPGDQTEADDEAEETDDTK